MGTDGYGWVRKICKQKFPMYVRKRVFGTPVYVEMMLFILVNYINPITAPYTSVHIRIYPYISVLTPPHPSLRQLRCDVGDLGIKKRLKQCECLSRKKIPGAVLLSHSQIYSTIAAGALNYRVREGNVCDYLAMSTGKKSK